jgi:hypothetical protein
MFPTNIHVSAANKMRCHVAVVSASFISSALVANFKLTNSTKILAEWRITFIGSLSNIWGKFPMKDR